MEAIISLDQIGLTFHRDGQSTEVLRDFTLDVPAGRFVAIIGPSGVGKSTLLRVIAGLLPPTTGRVTIRTRRDDGRLAGGDGVPGRAAAALAQVVSNVCFGLEHGRVSAAERIEKSATPRSRWSSRPTIRGTLSPSSSPAEQRQRVALARALAVDPDILLMDEPFARSTRSPAKPCRGAARIYAATAQDHPVRHPFNRRGGRSRRRGGCDHGQAGDVLPPRFRSRPSGRANATRPRSPISPAACGWNCSMRPRRERHPRGFITARWPAPTGAGTPRSPDCSFRASSCARSRGCRDRQA